jgi:hypothetical protein
MDGHYFGYSLMDPSRPFHRKNRRRERPGARTRKALSTRENFQQEYTEGRDIANDRTFQLPTEQYLPCSCSICKCEREYDWAQMRKEDEIDELENEQRRLFGGDVGDDVSLLPAMLDVVRFLWGDIDYTDP